MKLNHFEAIRSQVNGRYTLGHNDPYLISFDLELGEERRQGIYLAEMEDEGGRKYLRLSTPIAPLTGIDPRRCLRFNWEQRTGFLAVSDLDGSPYLHLCENRPYDLLTDDELKRLIDELGTLGDTLEQALSDGSDAF
ncbi:YbjN domain-containing protein [Oleiagrimonas sp. C23AA]|uniref:YbjN domain-containing protein n=1 Tax=Oleiagrimonas sp. C23AA TaxID=2719047 RepID=UPI001421F698|nr:YbjN domain-containing protein [Oleiagrimonas sp. C23AA]NII11543.1 YbjN domain-containing protein [Oleiagrimonas sp. C23AA]